MTMDQTSLAPESDPAATPASRNRQGWDIAVTIIVLMLNATFLAVALFVEVYSVSFVDICPTTTATNWAPRR